MRGEVMGLTLSLKDKKSLFFRACRNAKLKKLEGEEFLDDVFRFIEEKYDVIDSLHGLDWNEQMIFEKHCEGWLKEFNLENK